MAGDAPFRVINVYLLYDVALSIVVAVAVKDTDDYVRVTVLKFTFIFGLIIISMPQLSVTTKSVLATLVTYAYGACMLNISD